LKEITFIHLKDKDTDLIFSSREGILFFEVTYFLFGTGMSILPELLAQIVAISFFSCSKNKKDKRRAGLAPEKKPSRQPLNKYRILSKKTFAI
jgi:hypothetical protein